MADPTSIRTTLAELERLWLAYPEMRLGQLLVVTQSTGPGSGDSLLRRGRSPSGRDATQAQSSRGKSGLITVAS